MKIKRYIEQSPVLAINLAYESIITKVNRELKKENLNLLQGLTLTTLFFEERENITPSELANLFETSRANMSHILSHLEYEGWIKRVLDKGDARKFHLELKAEGRKKALSLIKFYDRLQDSFEKEIGLNNCQKTVDGIRQLVQVFSKKT